MKGIRFTEILKEIRLEGVRGELESKKSFQRQSFTRYLRLTLVFVADSALREKFYICFQELFACINKILLRGDWNSSYSSSGSSHFPDIS